jgi:alkanesulfonate monooxygenase SsuD/methylene tetrahydromethanopterin reductase-like flavin-dependent oxidoreductase (luciferase family)
LNVESPPQEEITTMTDPKLGLVLSTVTRAPPHELVEIARHCEDHGFDAVLVNEGRGDALACAEAIALGTEHIHVGTNIANIYLRHPYLAAATARTIAALCEGRFLLGLGMSHRGLLEALGIDMGDARQRLRDYAAFVRNALAGDAGSERVQPPASAYPVPIYIAANTVESATVAGEVGDGIMPFLSPISYLPSLIETAKGCAGKMGGDATQYRCILSVPTFVSEDEAEARSAARYNLAYFARLPNYRRQWRRAGYVDAMNAVRDIWLSGDRRAAAKEIPDRLVEEVCVFGSPERCRAQLDAFRAAGVDVPVLAVSPVNEERLSATRKAIGALGPR